MQGLRGIVRIYLEEGKHLSCDADRRDTEPWTDWDENKEAWKWKECSKNWKWTYAKTLLGKKWFLLFEDEMYFMKNSEDH